MEEEERRVLIHIVDLNDCLKYVDIKSAIIGLGNIYILGKGRLFI